MSEIVKEKLENALAFGHGKLVVETATIYGKPAVIINKAIHGGAVGEIASKEDHIPADDLLEDTILLTFPTMGQAQRVSDALVNQPTSIERELVAALRGTPGLGFSFNELEKRFDTETVDRILRIERLIKKAEGRS